MKYTKQQLRKQRHEEYRKNFEDLVNGDVDLDSLDPSLKNEVRKERLRRRGLTIN